MFTPNLQVTLDLEAFQSLLAPEQGHPAAGQDAFLDGRLGGVHSVLDPGLLLLELGLGGRADLDQGHAGGADV